MSTTWQTRFFERAKGRPTVEKHHLLAAAFADWLRAARPASAEGERLVFDGFAGAGRFAGDAGGDRELGSPLLFLRWAERWGEGQRLRFVFAEKHPQNFGRLCEALGQLLHQPSAAAYTTRLGRIEVRQASFESCAAELLAIPARGSDRLFSFVDPYGYDGLCAATLAALAERGALVVHVAARAIYTKVLADRGASPKQARRMDAFFGGAEAWVSLCRQAEGLDAPAVKRQVAELMRGRLAAQPGVQSVLVRELRDGAAFLLTTRPALGNDPTASEPRK